MIAYDAALAKLMDWHALQVAAMLPSFQECARGDSKLTEANHQLKHE